MKETALTSGLKGHTWKKVRRVPFPFPARRRGSPRYNAPLAMFGDSTGMFRTAIALALLVLQIGLIAGHGQENDRLVISELMAANDQTLLDSDGEASDWIEIRNPTDVAIDLQGWFLTDAEESPKQWAFPSVTLPPDAYLLVFASGNDRRQAGEELHTSFRLDRGGEYLALTHSSPKGIVVSSEFAPYPRQRTDVSYGRTTTPPSDNTGYFKNPTPNEPNAVASLSRFVAKPELTAGHGLYSSPIAVTLTCATPGADLRYTTDGSAPGSDHGIHVSAPDPKTAPGITVTISETTTLRVVAIKPGLEPSDIETATFIFPRQVMEQDGRGKPFSTAANWGHAGPDWELDPKILDHADPEVRPVPNDLKRIPTISLVTGFDQLFGEDGIYIAGEDDERPASIEMLNPGGDPENVNAQEGFQADGTVQIVGGSSPNRWKSDKLSMRFKFQPDLEYPVFGETAATRFDTLVLDARLNNTWHYGGGVEPRNQRGRAQYVRDQYAANLHNAMGGTSPHGRHVHLYLNGIYWGIHTLHERPDDNFAASYFGGKNEHYDSLKHNPNDLLQGSSGSYLRLHELADRNLKENANYQAVRQRLDIPAFIRYILVNYYVGNQDWAHHNWYASFNRVAADGRWRFHSWDAEKGLHDVMDDVTGRNDQGAPTNLHHDLIDNREYRLRFADMAYQALRHGVLSPKTAARHYRDLTENINLAMRLESARWGDNQRNAPFTRLDWLETRDEIFGETGDLLVPLYNYFARRSGIVLQQFRDRGWLPAAEPPTFNRHGGRVDKGFPLEISSKASGTIYYTLDGSDPRIPTKGGEVTTTEPVSLDASKRALIPAGNGVHSEWLKPEFDAGNWPIGTKGARYDNNNEYDGVRMEGGAPSSVAPSAREYTDPIPLLESTMVKARLRNGNEWSPLGQAEFIVGTVPPSPSNLVISRAHYHPAPATETEAAAGFTSHRDFELLELLNIGDRTIDLRGLRFTDGIEFAFDNASDARELAPGTRLILVSNRAAFRHRYGASDLVVGEFQQGTQLDNGGERLAAVNAEQEVVIEVTYDDAPPWPEQPDGEGYSLVLRDPTGNPDPNDPTNWQAQAEAGGAKQPASQTLQAWLETHFSASELDQASISGLDADPDSDRFPNALEFFHHTDPRSAEPERTLNITYDPGSETPVVEIDFVKRAELEELTWELTASSDLANWIPVSRDHQTVAGTNPDGTENIRFSVRLEKEITFFRLEITGAVSR